MKLDLSYDPHIDAWTLTHWDVLLETREDIEEWRRQLEHELSKLGGERVYLLIDLAGFELSSRIAAEYGRTAKEVTARHALGVIRYGAASADSKTTLAVRLQSVINRFPANIFADRLEALEALEKIKAL